MILWFASNSLWVVGFEAEICFFYYLGVHLGAQSRKIPYAYAQSNFKDKVFLSLVKKKMLAFETIC